MSTRFKVSSWPKNINNIVFGAHLFNIQSLKAAGLSKEVNVGLFYSRMIFAQCLGQNVQILTKLSCHLFSF